MIHLSIPKLHFDFDLISSEKEIISIFENTLKNNGKGYFIAVNPEKIVNTSNRDQWQKIWPGSLGNFIDGIGVVYAAGIIQKQKVKRIFFLHLVLEELNQRHGKIFLFGSKPKVGLLAKENIEKKYPNIQVVDVISGYNFDSKDVVERINASKPDVVLVALGSPIQEEWIYENLTRIDQGIFLGVGGALDIWSGKTNRAPVFFQKIGMEWLYRLVTQPSRFRRQLKLVVFVWAVFVEKFHRLFKS